MSEEIIRLAEINLFLDNSRFYDDPYEDQDRENDTLEFGTAQGPISTCTAKRGGDGSDLIEDVENTRKIWSEQVYLAGNDESRARTKIYNEHLQEFYKTPIEDLFFVFHDDCVALDKPLKYPEWSSTGIQDEWNVFSNYRLGNPEFLEVWNRRKLTYNQAIERIKASTPKPKKVKPPFSIDTRYKEEIEKILPCIVPIDDNTPHKTWEIQNKLRDKLRQYYALHAAEKFMLLMVKKLNRLKPELVQPVSASARNKEFALSFKQCDYDDWNGWYKFLSEIGPMPQWNGDYGKFPELKWDLSQDPDFAESEQKIFPVRLSYYNSHACGW